MKLRYKIAGALLVLVAVALIALGLTLSHDSPCGATAALANDAQRMQAITYRCYGGLDVLKLADIARPAAADDEVLIRVHAAAVNPLDWHYMRGTPYLLRIQGGIGAPKWPRLGVDFAGTVEAVGSNVKRLRVGDEVFGGADGAFAQYVTARDDDPVVLKPASLSFEQAAALPIAGITALQALRDKGHLQAGQKVLINGASGGVGTFAVQIAKSMGAEVTGVCSTRNVDLVRSIGADHVIDYTQQDFTRDQQHYDLIVDTVGNHPLLDYRRVLTPNGVFVILGGPSGNPWIGPLTGAIKALLLSPFVHQKFLMFIADLNQRDLDALGDLVQAGKLAPVVDRSYSLAEVAAAVRYLELGHARGKVVISVP
jgi:NADPH:quinone reductase-like Zn-dependent oxidoreductase